jgi:hypothetical protein
MIAAQGEKGLHPVERDLVRRNDPQGGVKDRGRHGEGKPSGPARRCKGRGARPGRDGPNLA